MAEAETKAKPGIGATLWSLLMIICLLLVVAHLMQAVTQDTATEEELINGTFTTARSDTVP